LKWEPQILLKQHVNYSLSKEIKMNPLERKKLLKEKLEEKKSIKNKGFVSFKDLNLKFNEETYEWYQTDYRGDKNESNL
jgi:hypothetical protein